MLGMLTFTLYTLRSKKAKKHPFLLSFAKALSSWLQKKLLHVHILLRMLGIFQEKHNCVFLCFKYVKV